MKRVFVTGATGFIGAAIARRLLREGYDVAILLRPASNAWRLGSVAQKTRVIEGEIDDVATYASALHDFSPDTVMHLAWHGVAKAKRDDPDQVRINVNGSVDLFRAAVQAGCKAFIGAGSQAEYGPSTLPLDEESPACPVSLYGAAKLATSILLSQLAAAHNIRFAWLRVFSVYGPQDDPATLISFLITEFLAGRRPAVSTGDQLWDYLYVDDAAAAFLAVGTSGAEGIFNVGSGSAVPLREAITCVRDAIDPSLTIGFGEIAETSGRLLQLRPVVDRLRSATNWAPSISLRDGASRTVAWAREQMIGKCDHTVPVVA
jgi:nucleoside-diphosphate-sugar epimerase